MGREKRRKFYQKEIVLYRSIFSFFVIAGISAAVIVGFYIFFSTAFVSLIINTGDVLPSSGITGFIGDILTSVWLYIMIGCVFLISVSTIFTHRFAGPLYRFEVSLDRMINKDHSFKIILRKGDECVSLGDKINLFNSKLSSSLNNMRKIVSEIDKRHMQLKDSCSDTDTLMKASRLNQTLRSILSEYEL